MWGDVFTISQRKLPSKCEDLGSFTIQCIIGNTKFEKFMFNLGSFLNIMPCQ